MTKAQFFYKSCAIVNFYPSNNFTPLPIINAVWCIALINTHLSVILSIDVTHKLTHTITVIVWRSKRMLLYTPAWREYDKVCHGHPRFCGWTCEHSEYGGVLHEITADKIILKHLDSQRDQKRLR